MFTYFAMTFSTLYVHTFADRFLRYKKIYAAKKLFASTMCSHAKTTSFFLICV